MDFIKKYSYVSKNKLDLHFVKKDPLGNEDLSADEGRRA